MYCLVIEACYKATPLCTRTDHLSQNSQAQMGSMQVVKLASLRGGIVSELTAAAQPNAALPAEALQCAGDYVAHSHAVHQCCQLLCLLQKFCMRLQSYRLRLQAAGHLCVKAGRLKLPLPIAELPCYVVAELRLQCMRTCTTQKPLQELCMFCACHDDQQQRLVTSCSKSGSQNN